MLSDGLINGLFDDAYLIAPQEMCGLLFADNRYLRCQNVDPNPERGFLLHHDEYREAVRYMGKAPWALVHSHPLASAGASPKDCGLMEAFEVAKLDMAMIIVGLNPREIRIFKKDEHVYRCVWGCNSSMTWEVGEVRREFIFHGSKP